MSNRPSDIPFLVEPSEAERLLRNETQILDQVETLISHGHDSLVIHRDACAHARELIYCHESDSPCDELPRLSAEQLLLFHLQLLDGFIINFANS